MDTLARLVVAALVVLPLVWLVMRDPDRARPTARRAAGARGAGPDDADERRLAADLAALADRGRTAQPPGVAVGVGVGAPSRVSADSASCTAWSSRFWAAP